MRKVGIIFGALMITAMFVPMVSAFTHQVNFEELGNGRDFYGVKIDDRHWYTLMTPGFETGPIAGRYLNPDYLTDDIDHDGKNAYYDFDDRDYFELYSTAEGSTYDGSGVTGELLVQINKYVNYNGNNLRALYFRVETMFSDNYHEGNYPSDPYDNWLGSSDHTAPAVEIHVDKLRINGDSANTTNRYSFVRFPVDSST